MQVKSILSGVDFSAVTEGLADGDVICIAGAEFLRDGQQVTLYRSGL